MNFCADCLHDGRCLDSCHRLKKAGASYYLPPIAVVGGLERGQVRCGICNCIYPIKVAHINCKIERGTK